MSAERGLYPRSRARQAATSEREKLTRILGLSEAGTRLQLAERLPDLPATLRDSVDIESSALSERLDVQAGLFGRAVTGSFRCAQFMIAPTGPFYARVAASASEELVPNLLFFR